VCRPLVTAHGVCLLLRKYGSYSSADPYIFFGNSLAELSPPAGNISSTITTNDTHIGGDGTVPVWMGGVGPVFVPTTDTLLARLQVTSATGSPPAVGDTFTMALEPGPSTFFMDPSFQELSYTSDPGQVHMVPEPSGLVTMLGLGACFVCGGVLLRVRRGAAR